MQLRVVLRADEGLPPVREIFPTGKKTAQLHPAVTRPALIAGAAAVAGLLVARRRRR
jgi:hypothetical protein